MVSEARASVLLADDDSDWREIVAAHLEAAGFAVAVARNGLVAWTSFLEAEPFVVVTDVQMPQIDGTELLARVHARNPRIPVILVTASEVLVPLAERAGAYAVIAKPVDPDQILAAVTAALAYRRDHTPLAKLWRVAVSLPRHRGRRWAPWLFSKRRQQIVAVSAIVALLIVGVLIAPRTLA